ncbi:MAG: Lysine-specific demethylase 4B [Stictis urceolatum]|nr:Lysine-specific demethylase 4B [Stictis urceolata]
MANDLQQLEDIIVQMAKSRDIDEAREIFSKHAPVRLRDVLKDDMDSRQSVDDALHTKYAAKRSMSSSLALTTPEPPAVESPPSVVEKGLKRGFCITKTAEPYWPSIQTRSIARGELQSQFLTQLDAGVHCVSENRIQLAESNQEFDIPYIDTDIDNESNLDYDDTELLFETYLDRISSSVDSHKYLTITAHDPTVRERLGLPPDALVPSDLTLSTRLHIPGIHSPYAYVSKGITAFSLHKEDFNLPSRNLLHRGMPKLWLMVPPGWRSDLETKLSIKLGIKGGVCDQFIRHSSLLITPSFLRDSGIPYSLHLQRPGEEVEVRGDTYHCGINLGCNIAEAINDAGDDWTAPPCYTPCARRKGWLCPDTRPILHKDLEICEYRPLDVNVDWETMQPQSSVELGERKRRRTSRIQYNLRQGAGRGRKKARRQTKVQTEDPVSETGSVLESEDTASEDGDCMPEMQQQTSTPSTLDTSNDSRSSRADNLHQTSREDLLENLVQQQMESVSDASPMRVLQDTPESAEDFAQSCGVETLLSLSQIRSEPSSTVDSNELFLKEDKTCTENGELELENEQTNAVTRSSLETASKNPSSLIRDQPLEPESESSSTPMQIEDTTRSYSQGHQSSDNNDETNLQSLATVAGQAQKHLLSDLLIKFRGIDDRRKHRESLLLLDQEWLQFYDEFVTRYPKVNVYQILNLASSVATPVVIKSLIDTFREGMAEGIQGLGSTSEHLDMKNAWELYGSASCKSSFYRLYERVLSTVLTVGLSQHEEHFRRMLAEERSKRRLLGISKTGRESPKALAIYHYLSQVSSSDFQVMRDKPKMYKAEKAKMETILRNGERYQRFDQYLAELSLQHLWLLLPKDGATGELDGARELYTSEFYSLSDDALFIFRCSLERLRPFIWTIYPKIEQLMVMLREKIPVERFIRSGTDIDRLADLPVDSSQILEAFI